MKASLLKKDISRLERVIAGDSTSSDILRNLGKKYRLERKGREVVLEELKQ